MKERFTTHIKGQYKQILKYFLIGILCFLVDVSLTLFFADHTPVHYLPGSAIGYLTGSVINYWLSVKWVFQKRNLKRYWKTEFTFFLVIEIIALFMMSGSLYLLKEMVFKSNLLLAKVLANCIAAIGNYYLKYALLFSSNRRIKKIVKEYID